MIRKKINETSTEIFEISRKDSIFESNSMNEKNEKAERILNQFDKTLSNNYKKIQKFYTDEKTQTHRQKKIFFKAK